MNLGADVLGSRNQRYVWDDPNFCATHGGKGEFLRLVGDYNNKYQPGEIPNFNVFHDFENNKKLDFEYLTGVLAKKITKEFNIIIKIDNKKVILFYDFRDLGRSHKKGQVMILEARLRMYDIKSKEFR